MDYPQTPAWEAGVRKAVMDGWAGFRTARTADELNRRLPQFEARMAEALADAFDDIYEEAIIGILLWMMAEDPGFQTVVDSFRDDPAMAYQLGQRRAARLASDMAQTNRRLLTDRLNAPAPAPTAPGVPTPSPGDNQGSFADWVENTLFGEPRADVIAITETTGALSEAELESSNIATTAAGSGLIVDARWFTAEDERVCPVCEPLHNTAYAVFSIYFPGGPPAHPRCRCRLEWRVRNRARRESYRLSVPLLEFDSSKHPRGPDGRFIGKMSGVEFGTWNMNHKSAQGAVKKIGELETAARKGDWDTFEKLMYKPKKGDAAKPNGYQKAVLKAQATILSKKPELDAKLAAKGKAPVADGDGAQMLAQANAELAATGQGKVSVGETKGASGETKVPSGETKGAKPATGTGKWEAVGGKLGTENGGVFKSPDGVKHYVKTPDNPARAHNEDLALQLYAAAGGRAVEGSLVDVGDGKKSVATKWIDSQKVNWNDPAARAKAAEDFAVHAWLNNWDAVGAGSENPMDNIRATPEGLTLVDAGGSLDYSGMGGAGKKVFKADAPEWESLRNKSINPTMAGEDRPGQVPRGTGVCDDERDDQTGQ